ncbi:protein of unknown function [Ralstonia solanacearum CMR15]|nr:protein of unknown function [Ralstonia solanacearum CMR15]
MSNFADVIAAIKTAEAVAYQSDDGYGTVRITDYNGGRTLTVVWNLNPIPGIQISGPKPLKFVVFDWTNYNTEKLPRDVTAEFSGRR